MFKANALIIKCNKFIAVTIGVALSLILATQPAFAVANSIIITEFMANPDNTVVISDNGGEWVELLNTTESDIDLTGWSIDDAVISPEGVVIAAESKLVVCRNTNVDENGGVLCKAQANFQLSNTGEAIEVEDDEGDLVSEIEYEAEEISEGQSTNVEYTEGDFTEAILSLEVEQEYGLGTQTILQNGTPNEGASYPVVNSDTSEGFLTIQEAIDDLDTLDGHTVLVGEQLSLIDDVDVNKEVTINGQGNQITANFIKTDNSNNAAFSVLSDNVTLRNIIVDGVNPFVNELHGINIFDSQNVIVENVTTSNFRSGVLYVSSSGTIRDISTSGSIWSAINVDRSSGAGLPGSNVTIEGLNTHAENSPNPVNNYVDGAIDLANATVPHLFIDDATDSGIVVTDIGNQYGLNEVSFRGGVALVGTYGVSTSTVVSEQDVRGSTTDGLSRGWIFGNPAPFDTPFEFNNDQAVLGEGALYVGPVDADANDKFIGYFFPYEEVRNIESFSYDFMRGAGADASDANEFYLNVYMQFEAPGSSWYDCRYNVVPAAGQGANFTTISFDPAQVTDVTQNPGSPITCPDRPLAMGAKATVLYMALNVGDTSANDVGVDGYFDNVRLALPAGITAYDFEPEDVTAPQMANTNLFVNGVDTDIAKPGDTLRVVTDVTDASGVDRVQIWVRDFPYTGQQITSGEMSLVSGDTYEFTFTLPDTYQSGNDVQETFEGNYYNFRPFDTQGNSFIGNRNNFTVDATAPTISVKDNFVGNQATKVFSEVSFKLFDEYEIDKYELNGQEVDLDNDSWSDANFQNMVSKLVEGNNTFVLFDVAGNSATYEFTYDVTAPTASNVSPADGAVVNGASLTQEWSSSATDVDFFEYESYNDAGGTSLRWSQSYSSTSKTATNVAESEFWWRVRAIDQAGNAGQWTDLWKITVDNSAPDVTIDSPADGAVVNGSVDINGSVNDQNLLRYFLVIRDESGDRVDGPGTVNEMTAFMNKPLFILDTTGLNDGLYTAFLAARDKALNRDAGSEDSVSFSVDNTAPVAQFGGLTTSETSPALTGALSSSADTVVVNVNGLEYSAVVNGLAWSIDAGQIAALAPGSYDVSIVAEDQTGNIDVQTFTGSLVISEPPVESQPEVEDNTDQEQDQPAVADEGTPENENAEGNDAPAAIQPFVIAQAQNGDAVGQQVDEPVEDDEVTVVLGEDDQAGVGEGEPSSDLGDTTDEDEGCFEIFGLCWYWWVVIGAGGSAAYYVVRRRS